MFALDTNVIIHAFQNKGGVAKRLFALPPDRIAVPAATLFEAEMGVLGSQNPSRRRQQMDELRSNCRILPFDETAAAIAARIQFDLEKQGRKIGALNILIAASAMAHGATLVTHNTREFERIPGLLLEDWF